MPGKKPPPKKPEEAPAWQVILEEMRSQNRTTIEAVQGLRDELKQDIAEFREDTNARFQVLGSAVRQNSADILELKDAVRENTVDIQELKTAVRGNSADIQELRGDVSSLQKEVRQNGADIRRLNEKVDNLVGLEVRVSALERQRT